MDTPAPASGPMVLRPTMAATPPVPASSPALQLQSCSPRRLEAHPPSAVPVRRPPPQRAVLWRGTPGSAPPRHPLRSIQSFTFRKNLLAVQSSAQPLHGSAPNRLASCHIFRATIAFPPQSSEVYGRRCAAPPSIQSVRLL